MDVDPYRLAYNVFHCNWEKFGIPAEDIPPPKTEKVVSLDPIIPGFSIAVVLFQIASRNDLKTFLDNECPTVHNLSDVYARFKKVMREALPKGTTVVDPPKDTENEGAMNEDVSQDTTEEYLSEDSMEEGLPEDIKKENLPHDAMKEDLPQGAMKEGLLEDAMKEGMSGNMIQSEDIPSLVAYSLAVCAELVLYERENENNKVYMKSMPDMWKKYFEKHLKPLCKEARCTQDHLKAYGNSIKCPEKFLNKFITENKNEYNDIADKFYDYTEKNFAIESPEHGKFIIEVRSFPKGLSFLKMKEKFTAIKEMCKCVKGPATDEIPLLQDYSPCSSSSTSTNL
ncbi:hypothetical protein AVEN_57808-1 [Araneus ventricosus]|uniref:Uncharacterized protein n=1 Tax=Araneus ventricosus TaxID=182803 RepID=A0A4Y2I8D5_ARAVE|nr:hypothetical protein AVEN_57808-1 [Araneus ventricosus]